MTIEELLKDNQITANIRVSAGNRWLYWDSEWVVQSREYGQKKNRCLYSGDNLDEALKALIS
jgi:hypothetical protein